MFSDYGAGLCTMWVCLVGITVLPPLLDLSPGETVADIQSTLREDESFPVVCRLGSWSFQVGRWSFPRRFMSMLISLLMFLERGRGLITSGVVFIFWFLLSVAGIIPLYTYLILKTYNEGPVRFSGYILYYTLVLTQLILNCFAEKRTVNSTEYRDTTWRHLIYKGFKAPLNDHDLFDLHPRDDSKRVANEFAVEWRKELEKYKQRRIPLVDGKESQKKTKKASLGRVMLKLYWKDMAESYCLKFISDILVFAGPILLSVLINLIDGEAPNGWMGYVLALGLFCLPWIQSVFYHQMYHMAMTLGMRVKAALMAVIYQKALKLNNEAQSKFTVGEIVNLMAVDCQRIQDAACYTFYVWSIPFQVAIAVYLLWSTMGPSSLAGLVVLILLVPVNAIVATKQFKYQKENLQYKDKRIKLTSEVLEGIKVLKLYAWECVFKQKILEMRKQELSILKKIANLNTLSTFVWTCAPYLVTLATFTCYVLTSSTGHLDAQKAFVTLSLFNILQFPINFIPETISYLSQAAASVQRIEIFLREEELSRSNVDKNDFMERAIKVDRGVFAWNKSSRPVLHRINIDISEGELVAVIGTVGSGKSSLLSAFLGEMERLAGKVATKGRVAYVSQQAWIQNNTARNNILFGAEMNKKQYKRVLKACALKEDLQILPGGEFTEIGEKGVNLSGGQKQRVNLARAVYSDSDIYLLDDPLSAVDSHVGKHIFKRVISDNGILKHKTRVLVTHAVHWLPLVDTVVLMDNGRIIDCGHYLKLMRNNGALAEFLHTHMSKSDKAQEATEDAEESSLDSKKKSDFRSRLGHLISEENAETGKVEFSVFSTYAKAVGVFSTIFIFVSYTIYQVGSVAANIWLSVWTEDSQLKNTSESQSKEYIKTNHGYLAIYGVFGLVQAVFILLYAGLSTTKMVKAAKTMHFNMLDKIIRAPMIFFETTPIGRIINRFSRDVETIDNNLPQIFSMWIVTIYSVASTFVVISVATPLFLMVIVPLILMYSFIQRYFVPTSRQLKRLESVSRSPIYSHFGESIQGATTIRAYEATYRFTEQSRKLIDKNQVYYFAGISANRWLGIWIEFVSSCVVFTAALFSLLSPDITGASMGLSVTYALQITAALKWLVRTISDLETNIVSVERVKEYTDITTEAPLINRHNRPCLTWPDAGHIQFQLYSTRYRPELDLVLRAITFEVKPGEKIGVVGRTGAGKSSLILALFRLVEGVAGTITLDGKNIEDIGLHDLRSKITILPQDPVLFSGTLRTNLDPFNINTDEELWTALDLAHLKAYVSGLTEGLEFQCGEGGQNFSVGQRQLVCLARALLRKTRVLVLDEATAAVDLKTDVLIQETIRTEFQQCTLITVAHRINTIMDYDRIMVLDKGKIVEFDSPSNLLLDPSTQFYSLARDSNI
ncbi:hypothetical protein LOTGIDRAFT_153611 [Lottia gigantea]|uniref:ABC-type glutathione-S-conjugate transporter n=1 Tax=Lottia gigantea TaxID=225164 RepID=V4A387_LOTGI|nr:hypothetical protein LOTGIDRAFT_153611 [Lottia gigantea]ESO91182.1 hypothetical protein LOTGIDRAFT_153611 [Lottia gigantea]